MDLSGRNTGMRVKEQPLPCLRMPEVRLAVGLQPPPWMAVGSRQGRTEWKRQANREVRKGREVVKA